MSPQIKYLLCLAASLGLSVLLLHRFGTIFIFLSKDYFGIPMLQEPPAMPWTVVLALGGCIIGMIASFFVCPLTAYFQRETVFAIADEWPARVGLFAFMGLSQIAFIAVVLLVTVIFPWLSESWTIARAEKKREEVRALNKKAHDELSKVPIEISASQTVISETVGDIDVADVTLQIRNVPDSLFEFNISLSPDQEEKRIQYQLHGYAHHTHPNGSIKAVKKDGAWSFFNPGAGERISTDPEIVPVRIAIRSLDRAVSQYPSSISFQISVPQEGGIPGLESLWWKKPVRTIIVRRIPG